MKTIYKKRFSPYLVKNPLLFVYLKILKGFSLCVRQRKNPCKEIKKILLCHMAHRGDIILATAALIPLRKKFPQAHIGFLTGSWSQDFLVNNPLIDEIYLFDHPKLNREQKNLYLKFWNGIASFIKAYFFIKKKRYDLFIDLYLFYPNGNVLSYLLSIPQRVGFISGGGEGFLTQKCCGYDHNKHMSEHYAELLSLLGISSQYELFEPTLFLEEKTFFLPFETFWIFHPFSMNSQKDLKEDFWLDVVAFFDQQQEKIVFIGKGKIQKEGIDRIIKKHENCLNAADATSIENIAYLVKRSKGVVCVDSVLAHLGMFYKKPVLVAPFSELSRLWYGSKRF